jgi:hypothetical protein
MLYQKVVCDARQFSPHEQFYTLLRQGRYDKALEIREDPKNQIGEDVFLLKSVREAGKEAIILAAHIGNAEDAKLFQKRFFLPETIFDDSDIKHALFLKLDSWREMRHPSAPLLCELYPFLCE